ncbi:LD-carboxypeptidase [Bacteroidetes/Chlorobi group bacterium MS-B_bin-24]|jgi:muramoyltetrapeptide carboxypeptidase|nr:MAG: LD-carboxypeptidase [Bacteroidetes/Chlorobi group bacterium MS-B_bin-24]
MDLGRRNFFTTMGLAMFALSMPTKFVRAGESSVECDYIVPASLSEGATVAFTASASPSNAWEIHNFVNYLARHRCKVILGETITLRDKKFRYLSKDDKFRANEINKFFADPSIKAIVSARGGYGSIRILDLIDYEIIKQNPKIFIGFSDITVLLNAITEKTRLITFHGPTGNFSLDGFTRKILDYMLFGNKLQSNLPFVYKFSKENVLNEGKVSGRLVGGNLSNLVSLLGTPFDFDARGKILFFEEVSEHPYKIDRMLKQLELSGKFEQCAGVVLGYFGKLDARRNFFPDYSFTLREIFDQTFKKYDFPVLINFPFGHTNKFFTFPIGGLAKVDTKNLEFSVNLYDSSVEIEKMYNK